ncbi:MAG: zinc ribbon domain-containing protein, partial [Planctomycetota bacterium]
LIGTGAGIIFKGSGFYQTDYRSESYKKAAANDKPKSEAGEKKSDASTGSAKSESSPAKKPKAKPAAD